MCQRLFLFICLLFMQLPSPIHAEEFTTVYAESGRFSLEIPEDWVIGELPRPRWNMGRFVGDTILIADSETTLENWNGGTTTGQLIFAHLWSLAGSETMEPEERLLSHFEAIGVPDTELEFFEINGYPAARYLLKETYSTHFFPNAEQVGQTTIITDQFLYDILYTGPDLALLETIAESLTIYAEPVTTERPPLAIDEVLAVPTKPGWLVMPWGAINPLAGFGAIGAMEATLPQYYLILVEEDWTLLDAIYKSMLHGSSVTTTALPGVSILVGVFPYDALLGSSTEAVDDDRRHEIFEQIAGEVAFRFDEVIEGEMNGVPTLIAESTQLLGWDTNQGTLLLIDAAPNFYAIMIAGPQAGWDALMTDDLLAQIIVTPRGVTEEGTQVGQRAPNFTATLLDGSTVSLSDYRGKFVVLDFWATWCEPCRAEMPFLQKAYEERDDLVVLAVDLMEDAETVSAFVEEYELTFPIALDLTGVINSLYNVNIYPTNFVIDREGFIIDIAHGIPDL